MLVVRAVEEDNLFMIQTRHTMLKGVNPPAILHEPIRLRACSSAMVCDMQLQIPKQHNTDVGVQCHI